jgi:hypothetical protein
VRGKAAPPLRGENSKHFSVLSLTGYIGCVAFEAARLNTIAVTVRDKFEDVLVSENAENFYNMQQSTRESGTGTRRFTKDKKSWTYKVNTNDVTIIQKVNSFFTDGEKGQFANVYDYEYKVSAPVIAGDNPQGAWRYNIDGTIAVKIPIVFGGLDVPPLDVKLGVHATWRAKHAALY